MPENPLEKAFRRAKVNRSHIQAEADKATTAEHGHSYKMSCPACQSNISFSNEDLEQFRTDDEAAETGNDDDSNERDIDGDDDDAELDAASKSKLVAKLTGKHRYFYGRS